MALSQYVSEIAPDFLALPRTEDSTVLISRSSRLDLSRPNPNPSPNPNLRCLALSVGCPYETTLLFFLSSLACSFSCHLGGLPKLNTSKHPRVDSIPRCGPAYLTNPPPTKTKCNNDERCWANDKDCARWSRTCLQLLRGHSSLAHVRLSENAAPWSAENGLKAPSFQSTRTTSRRMM